MTTYEQIRTVIMGLIDQHGGVDIISPTSLAHALRDHFATGPIDPQRDYASLEHFKHMARRVLGSRFDADGEESEVYQGELFSGELQRRYPTPHKRGEDPQYKLLEIMTDAEIEWNETSLQRSADARAIHARALRAYRLSRMDCAA